MRLKSLMLAMTCLAVTACSQEAKTEHSESTTSACAEDSGVVISDAWVRAAPASRPTSAIYLTICNGAAEADTLVSASFAGAENVELHETITSEDGVASMTPVENIVAPAGQSVAFTHGGAHIMLIGLTEDISAGATPTVTLTFENAGDIEVPLEVKDGMHSGGH